MLLLLLFTYLNVYSQNRVQGRVVASDTHNPLSGVTVLIAGKNIGAITDANGRYIVNASPGDSLIFRFLGYTEQRVAVGNRSTIDIELSPSSSVLNELVVIGYGTQRREDVTGAVGSVKSKDF